MCEARRLPMRKVGAVQMLRRKRGKHAMELGGLGTV